MDRERLFTALKHGDQDHQDWLREAIGAFFDGKPVPVPRGSGNKEKRIAELEGQIVAWNTRSPEAVTDETVTPEMIEAGVSFIYGMDHNFGETAERRCDLDVLRADIRAFLDAALSKVSPLI